MDSRSSTLALFKGAVVSGIGAGLVGPIVLYAWNAISRGPVDFVSSTGLKGYMFVGLVLGGIGITVALVAGFPVLLALRKFGRLSLVSAVTAGAAIGLATSLLLRVLDSFELMILPVGCVTGALCTWLALLVTNEDFMRPNTSLERAREE